MEVGQTSETVNVSAEAPVLNTVDASVGNAFNETQIRQLPLDTRNIVELLSLQPGVTSTGEVMGSRRDQNNVTLDGVDVNDNQNSGIGGGRHRKRQGSNANGVHAHIAGFNSVLPIPLDSVQEFRVTVAGQGADEGRSSGGQVVLVTKSGTNQLHGSAYEYNRNTLFAANTWFNNRSGVDRQVLNRNQFGASLGGPDQEGSHLLFLQLRAPHRRQPVGGGTPGADRSRLKPACFSSQDSDGTNYTLTPAQIQADRSAAHRRQPGLSEHPEAVPGGQRSGLRRRWRTEFHRLPLQRAGQAGQSRLCRQDGFHHHGAARRSPSAARFRTPTRTIRTPWRSFPARRPPACCSTTARACRQLTPSFCART